MYCATSKAGYAAWQESWITMVPGLKGIWVFRPISWRGHVQVISAVHPLSCFWMQQLNMPWRNHASFLLSCSGANANIDSKKHQKTYTAILNSPNFFLTLVTLVMEIPHSKCHHLQSSPTQLGTNIHRVHWPCPMKRMFWSLVLGLLG